MEAVKLAPSGQPPPPDVWTALVSRAFREWDFSLISLDRMGLRHDDEGFIYSASLIKLPGGAEAQPFCEPDTGVVYKLFDLRENGSLGKKLRLGRTTSGEYELAACEAVLPDTLEKVCVLHEAGAHPTEIAGLSDDYRFLIVKQPLAFRQPYHEGIATPEARDLFLHDRDAAIRRVRGVVCHAPGFRQTVAVIAASGHTWLMADLHPRNIMHDHEGQPTIIDALIGPVPPAAAKALPSLARAAAEAAEWSRTGIRPDYDPLGTVNDDEL